MYDIEDIKFYPNDDNVLDIIILYLQTNVYKYNIIISKMDLISNKSAHHGFINYENQLSPIIMLFATHTDVGILEIDFYYHNGEFVSSHDGTEENLSKGSSLEQWVDCIITHNKILWIDVKDTTSSIISEEFSVFDVDVFYQCLQRLENKYMNLKNNILIGCQYTSTYNNLINKNIGYNIIHDMPRDFAYILNKFLPLVLIKSCIHNRILEDLQGITGIVCLDHTFFDDVNELNTFITMLPHQTIIVYSYDISEKNLPKVPGKHIIHQFDYRY